MSEDNLYEESPTVLFRPSYSATSLFCEAALLDGRFYPDTAGEAAAQGTVFHDLMAEWVTSGVEPTYRLHQIAEIWKPDTDRDQPADFLIEVDEDMFRYGEQCVKYIADFLGTRYIERRVDISHLTPIPNQSGTLDVGFVDWRRLDICDWKYGIGVKVFAKDNTQLLIYASGMFEEWDFIYHFDTIGMHIAQPRLGHWDYWEITREQMLEFNDFAKDRWKAAWKRKGRTYTVGVKQCHWCKRRLDCKAKLAALEAIADESFEADDPITEETAKEIEVFVPPASMQTTIIRLSTEELAGLYKYRRMFESWFKQIGEALLERGTNGEDIGDFYVTEGRKFRHWKDQKEIAEKLSLLGLDDDEIFDRKIKSPNQMLKGLRRLGIKGKVLDQYINLHVDRIPGKPTLVPKGDGRSALPDYTEEFEGEE